MCRPLELPSIKSKTFINPSAKHSLTLDVFTSGHDPLWRANHSFIKIFLVHSSFNTMHLGVKMYAFHIFLTLNVFPPRDETDRIFPLKWGWNFAGHFQKTFPLVVASLFLWGLVRSVTSRPDVATNLRRLQQFLWSRALKMQKIRKNGLLATNLGRLQQFLWSVQRPWIWPCTCNSSHLASSLMDAWKY